MCLESTDLGWLRVSCTDRPGALRWVEETIRCGKARHACFCEASLLANMSRNPAVAEAVRGADAVFPDGIAMVILGRLLGYRLPGRIPGPSFLPAACEHGLPLGWRHYFYGGAPGVADRLAERLRARFPGLQVVGAFAPPFRPLTTAEEEEVKFRIEASGADLLWVCLGSPKQELWAAEHVGKIRVPVILPVGAAFDFHSGHRPWAPSWIRAVGMEWLFRTLTGGHRTFLRNIRCVPRVVGILSKAALHRVVGRR